MVRVGGLLVLVNQIEPTYVLLVAFQSELIYKYIPSRLIIVMVSSMSPILSSSSSRVFAVIDGPPLTSSSQALPVLSKMKSKP